MGNICYCNKKVDIEDVKEQLTMRNTKRYFILTKGDFLEVNKIYEKHELHTIVD